MTSSSSKRQMLVPWASISCRPKNSARLGKPKILGPLTRRTCSTPNNMLRAPGRLSQAHKPRAGKSALGCGAAGAGRLDWAAQEASVVIIAHHPSVHHPDVLPLRHSQLCRQHVQCFSAALLPQSLSCHYDKRLYSYWTASSRKGLQSYPDKSSVQYKYCCYCSGRADLPEAQSILQSGRKGVPNRQKRRGEAGAVGAPARLASSLSSLLHMPEARQ